MEPKKVGRVLGIGARVASNMLRERMARAAKPQPACPNTPPEAPRPVSPRQAGAGAVVRPAASGGRGRTQQAAARQSVDKMANARRGASAFGRALLGPFTHAGSILWLEMTGLFFALFALFFVQSIYRVHIAWRQGAEHSHLLLYCALALLFSWFSASSFLRARRKSKRGPAAR